MPCGTGMIDVSALIMDLAEFFSAAKDLERVRSQARQVRGRAVEASFKDALGRDFGLAKKDKGYELVADSEGLTHEQQTVQAASIKQIVQRYAYRKAVKDLQAKGFSIVEDEKKQDGTIRLLLRRWA